MPTNLSKSFLFVKVGAPNDHGTTFVGWFDDDTSRLVSLAWERYHGPGGTGGAGIAWPRHKKIAFISVHH